MCVCVCVCVHVCVCVCVCVHVCVCVQSLAGIDDAITRVKVKVQQKDEEIRSVVRGQADVGHDGGQALGEAQHSIAELFGRIRSIKEKAERSEHMVNDNYIHNTEKAKLIIIVCVYESEASNSIFCKLVKRQTCL